MGGNLKLFNILVADSDEKLGKVFHQTLQDMGFSNVALAANGAKALEALKNKPFDLLITEWNLQKINGMELISNVRRSPNSPDPTLPIIMLTGRAEQNDVLAARDAGVNEYVIKPFTARTIYRRLERVIEHPRNFIVSSRFIGPERRNNGGLLPGMEEKRKISAKPQLKPKAPAHEINNLEIPRIWVVDHALSRKLGKGNALSSLITPEILKAAQASIDAVTIKSLSWIRTNLQKLQQILHNLLTSDQSTQTLIGRISEETLSLSGRAGTFGYANASKIAYMLYLFCSKPIHAEKNIIGLIIEKHINVLQVTLSPTPSKIKAPQMALIIHELENLAKKFAT